MSEANVEIVRRSFDAFKEGNVSGMLELMADDLITHRSDPDGATYHGKEGFFQATADWIEDWEWTATTPRGSSTRATHVLVRVLQTARGKGSGVPVESDFWFVFGFCVGERSRG